ncbi:MAG: hypothetical protein QNJ91_10400 [Gammaproteobacteria bacterium]|nr:hypothetical protein [Gammaproteobacteria bacterium]
MKLAWLLLVPGLLYGCSAALPHGESRLVSRWSSFAEAKQAYDQVVAYQTRRQDLRALGFSPDSQPNVRILNHADLAERFLLVSANNPEELPEGLRECREKSADCDGYEVQQRQTRDRRYGNFFADIFNFKRKTEITGWEFTALLVLVDDVVVYKVWGGTPDIREYRDKTNPLGPLQGVGPDLVPRPSL